MADSKHSSVQMRERGREGKGLSLGALMLQQVLQSMMWKAAADAAKEAAEAASSICSSSPEHSEANQGSAWYSAPLALMHRLLSDIAARLLIDGLVTSARPHSSTCPISVLLVLSCSLPLPCMWPSSNLLAVCLHCQPTGPPACDLLKGSKSCPMSHYAICGDRMAPSCTCCQMMVG